MGTATNWVSVSAGNSHSLGITAEGKLWAWENNGYGQLSDGTVTSFDPITHHINVNDKNNPTQVGTATNWVSVAGAIIYSLGITADVTTWAWGYNQEGELGDGTNTDKSRPGQLAGQTAIATGLAITGSATTMQQGQYNVYNSGGNFIASLSSTRASLTPITGLVTAKVWIEATQPAHFLSRHYQITPASNAATVTGRPTLYFKQSEFDAFNAVNAVKLPTSSSDATGIANLLIEKRSGVSSDGSGLPDTYPSNTTPITINPTDADIVWNTALSRWEVSFDVIGFSGFFVKTQASTLPLKLTSFSGSKVTGVNHLVWTSTNEVNTKQFNIEWSMDAIQWNTLGSIAAYGNMNNTDSYNHRNAPGRKIFYRLKMLNQDAQFTYSPIISLNGSDNKGIVVYPNPVKSAVNINTGNSLLNTIVSLSTIEGTLLQSILITANQQAINLQQLPGGMYLLTFANGSIEKFIKE